jgi:leader peptidase (prepilin peptidase)/N-methyltransferase
MMRMLATVFAGLFGLAFGSFLNVCLSRWPHEESIVHPGSHCRQCQRTLAWWENIPVISWIALGGRCRTCRAWIGLRYPLVEISVAVLWAAVAWRSMNPLDDSELASTHAPMAIVVGICMMIFCWLLVALAFLDAEDLWLPDRLTLPGAALGFLLTNLRVDLDENHLRAGMSMAFTAVTSMLSILAAAGFILLIRWVYWLIRRREGVGLGDAKLMALLAAWLGLPGAIVAFDLGILLGALAAVFLLTVPSSKADTRSWSLRRLPLGTFLCVGGIVSGLWGRQIIDAYLRWSGF